MRFQYLLKDTECACRTKISYYLLNRTLNVAFVAIRLSINMDSDRHISEIVPSRILCHYPSGKYIL